MAYPMVHLKIAYGLLARDDGGQIERQMCLGAFWKKTLRGKNTFFYMKSLSEKKRSM